MAAVVCLAALPKGLGKLYCVLAGARKGAPVPRAVASWRRDYSSGSKQVPAEADMPLPMENPYKEPPKKCILCGITVDYKNIQLLSQFISPYTGNIFGRSITGLCLKKQSEISKAIKRAQKMGSFDVYTENQWKCHAICENILPTYVLQ